MKRSTLIKSCRIHSGMTGLYTLIFLCCLIPNFLNSQISRFREYREKIVQAENKILANDLVGAHDLYDIAYKDHGFLMVKDLSNAAICAGIQGKTIEAAQWMRELLRQGVPKSELEQKAAFESVWTEAASQKILNRAEEYTANGRKYRDPRYRKSLDSLNILKTRYLEGDLQSGKAMASGLLAVFNLWGMPGEQITGVEKMDGTTLYDEIIDIITENKVFSKHHAALQKTLLLLLERGCIYPDKAASWIENMNQKSKKGFEKSGAVNLSDKQRILYILPPNRRASIIAQYLKENPESEFILKW